MTDTVAINEYKNIQIIFILLTQLIHNHSRYQQKIINQCCKWLEDGLLMHGTEKVMKSSS
jgi:hypothetical protein